MESFKKMLETMKTMKKTIEEPSVNNFTIEDIIEILNNLDQDELNEIGEFILDLIYEPDFDLDEIEETEELEEMVEEKDLNEVKYFKTKKRELDRAKKQSVSQRRKAAKERKKYYRKNKSKLKRKNKLYRKKVKRNPNKVKKHRN